jgi:hypothetical protein
MKKCICDDVSHNVFLFLQTLWTFLFWTFLKCPESKTDSLLQIEIDELYILSIFELKGL